MSDLPPQTRQSDFADVLARRLGDVLAEQRHNERISSDHDIVIRLDTNLQALDRLVTETRVSDRRALEIADGAAKAALALATGNLDSRLDDLNELRGNVISADRYEADQTAINARLGPLESDASAASGRSTGSDKTRNLVVAVLGAVAIAVSLFLGLRKPTVVAPPAPAPVTATTLKGTP